MIYFSFFSNKCVDSPRDLSFPRCDMEDMFNTYLSLTILAVIYLICIWLCYRTILKYKKHFAVLNLALISGLFFSINLFSRYFSVISIPFIIIFYCAISIQHLLVIFKKPNLKS